ncbi:MAG: ATP-binding protein [Anaerolineaceae bacterium]|nr:ATP-binding protein [Anaerolineaceae bacterium]
MNHLVILSGKGGTGKTSFTAAAYHLAVQDPDIHFPVLVDADVDASNLNLLLSPVMQKRESFSGGELARIDSNLCIACGACFEACRFDAILEKPDYQVEPLACEGCGYCELVCPTQAITLKEEVNGEWYISKTQYGSTLVHAELYPGQENSGKLVAHIKEKALAIAQQNLSNFILVDGPPGIGCAVIASISGASAAIIVTEPSMSGIHDMLRAIETANHFQIKPYVCINKYDISAQGTAKIKTFCQENQIPILGEIPFDLEITRAMSVGLPITAFNPKSQTSKTIEKIWETIKNRIIT